jgi:hypothetical protein
MEGLLYSMLKVVGPTDLAINIIFRTAAGGKALAEFIEATQACIRPRRRPPEDHG